MGSALINVGDATVLQSSLEVDQVELLMRIKDDFFIG